MMINKVDSTRFSGQMRFVRPGHWEEEIIEACEKCRAFNRIAGLTKKDLYLDLSTKKMDYSYVYKIHATASSSSLEHIFKRITGINKASLSRRPHGIERTIDAVIPSFDQNEKRKDWLISKVFGIK